jgi:glycosyltransferase involved in cell wall biosynthesis
MTPAISVVMSVYNGEAYLHESINSILLQTFTDFEFIIVDDGSTDNSLSIIKSFSNERIVLFSQQNSGLARALNNGIKLAKAPLIARMDADDIALPERLQKQYDFMQEFPDCVACGSWADVIDKDGNYVYTRETIVDRIEIKNFFRKSISNKLPSTPFFHSSVMFRIKAFNQVGGYKEYMRRAQDVVLFNKMSSIGDCYNLPAVLLKYRVVPGAIGGRKMAPELLGDILIKAINNEAIDDKLINTIEASLSKSNINEREFNYFLYLAKKYLWNNYSPWKARRNLILAMKMNPLSIISFLLYILTLLPKKLVLKIYSMTRRFD